MNHLLTPLFVLSHCTCAQCAGGVRRRDGHISVYFPLFVFLYNMYKVHEQILILCKKNNKNTRTIQIHHNLHNPPIFHSEEGLVSLVRGRERFDGLSSY